jgi:hypothetical protein
MNSRTAVMIPDAVSVPFVGPDGVLVALDDAEVAFRVIGPAGIRIVGSTSDLSVVDDGQRLTVAVSLVKLTTGIPLRDAHMREHYLQVARFPSARLTVARAELKFPDFNGAEGTATGIMTIHGQSREVTFHYSAVRGGAWMHVSAEAEIDMTDYGVVVPPYLGMTVRPGVALRVSFSVLES